MFSRMSFKSQQMLAALFLLVLPFAVLGAAAVVHAPLNAVWVLCVMAPVAVGWYMAHGLFSASAKLAEKAKEDFSDSAQDANESDAVFFVHAFERMSERLKAGVEELSHLSKSSESLNQEVVSSATLLSAAVKLNELLSFDAEEKSVHSFIVEKVKEIFGADAVFLMLENDDHTKYEVKSISSVRPLTVAPIPSDTPCMKLFFADRQIVIVDKQHEYIREFREYFEKNLGVKNILLAPIIVDNAVAGIFACAAFSQRLAFSGKDIETVEFFVKYIAFLRDLDHGQRSRQRDNEFKDALTGLYTEQFMTDRLDEELAKAQRSHKPCALVLFKLTGLPGFVKTRGSLQGEAVIKKVARTLAENLQEGEKAARSSDDTFGLILPGLNKRRVEMAARGMLSKFKTSLGPDYEALAPVCSYAECPLDGLASADLVVHAQGLFAGVKEETIAA